MEEEKQNSEIPQSLEILNANSKEEGENEKENNERELEIKIKMGDNNEENKEENVEIPNTENQKEENNEEENKDIPNVEGEIRSDESPIEKEENKEEQKDLNLANLLISENEDKEENKKEEINTNENEKPKEEEKEIIESNNKEDEPKEKEENKDKPLDQNEIIESKEANEHKIEESKLDMEKKETERNLNEPEKNFKELEQKNENISSIKNGESNSEKFKFCDSPNETPIKENNFALNKINVHSNFKNNNSLNSPYNPNDSLDVKLLDLMDKINKGKTSSDKKEKTNYIFDNLNSPNCAVAQRSHSKRRNNKINDIFNYISESRTTKSPKKNYYSPGKFNLNLSNQSNNKNFNGSSTFNSMNFSSSPKHFNNTARNLLAKSTNFYRPCSPTQMNTTINNSPKFMSTFSPSHYRNFSNDPQNNLRNLRNENQSPSRHNYMSATNIFSGPIKAKMREMVQKKNESQGYWGNEENIFHQFLEGNNKRSAKQKGENFFNEFIERRKLQKQFDKIYFNNELKDFNERLFSLSEHKINSKRYKKNTFNRLKLNL